MLTSRQHRLAIVGDLHFETDQEPLLLRAQKHLIDLQPEIIVSLGDQGGYSHCGTRLSFEEGRDYFSGFGVPFYPLIGNHDMESREFKTDKEAVAAWCEVFERQRPYTIFDLGTAVGITLSQTSFRQNEGSHQEVHIDEVQLDWFAETLAANRDRPIFVFSHAPILGSGIRILQDLHLKGPNAFLNHYTQPERFMKLIAANPQVKLWVSGHIHVGHHYNDTINQVGRCTFVHGGVIGNHTRDGDRHTRFLTYDTAGFDIHTVDHQTGQTIADYTVEYATNQTIRQRAFASHKMDRFFPPPPFPNSSNRLTHGRSIFTIHRNMLLEYDRELGAPLGVVNDFVAEDAQLDIEDDALIIRSPNGKKTRQEPNEHGRYLRVYAPNPWHK